MTAVIDWLLDSDPAIRWQVMRDLTHEPADVVAAERATDRHRGLGCPAARAPGARRPVGRPGLVARLHGHLPRPGAAAAAGARSGQRAGPAGHRPRSRARHLGRRLALGEPLGPQRLLRGRGRALHQRQRRRHRLVLRRGHERRSSSGSSVSSSPTAAGTARWRTAPRCRRSGRRSTSWRVSSSTSGRSAAPPVVAAARRRGRGVHARARALPSEVDRRGDRRPPGCGSRSRPGGTTTSCAAWTISATPASSPTSESRRRSGWWRPTADADGRWPLQNVYPGEAHFQMEEGEGQPEPLEHAPGVARARLVRARRLTPHRAVRGIVRVQARGSGQQGERHDAHPWDRGHGGGEAGQGGGGRGLREGRSGDRRAGAGHAGLVRLQGQRQRLGIFDAFEEDFSVQQLIA